MYCPKCNKNYSDEITICPDCNVSLIESSPDETEEVTQDIEPVKIVSFSNGVDAGIAMDLLISNNIPCFKKSMGSGGYMNIYMGYSVFGEDIYVSQKDYQRASELLSNITSEEVADVSEDTQELDSIPFYRKPQIIARIIIISSIVLVVLIYIFIYILSKIQ